MPLLLGGLPQEYGSVISVIETRFEPLPIEEVEALLLAHDMWLENFWNKSASQLNFRSHECLFLGYSPCHKGYRCLSPTGKLSICKDVINNELRFPYHELFSYSPAVSTNPLSTSTNLPTSIVPIIPPSPIRIPPTNTQTSLTQFQILSYLSHSLLHLSLHVSLQFSVLVPSSFSTAFTCFFQSSTYCQSSTCLY